MCNMLAVVFLAAIVGTLGAPIDDSVTVDVQPAQAVQPVIEILSTADVVNADGSFNYGYEAANGIKVEESGYIKKNPNIETRLGGEGTEGEEGGDIRVVTGSFSYTAPDGTVITLKYIADENGFQPIGDHLPVAPAVPEAIQRSLDAQSSGAQERSGKSVDLPPVKATKPAPAPSAPEVSPSAPEVAPSAPEEAPKVPEAVPTEQTAESV